MSNGLLKNKLDVLRNKKSFYALTLLLIMAFSVVVVALPIANAQSTKSTFAFIGAAPNPIGVGQETLLTLGITDAIGTAADGWMGLTVSVTKPDGTTETLGPFKTDSTGGTGTVYLPTMTGSYTLQLHFPAQWFNFTGFDFATGGMVTSNVFYKASDSAPLTLIVQEEKIPDYPSAQLPTEYWTRPIDSQLREWFPIAGSWLYEPANRVAPYNEGPESAHILWTKPLTLGGLVGGEYGLLGSGETSVGMETGDAYEGKWGTGYPAPGYPIILNGRIYYHDAPGSGRPDVATRGTVVYHCIDLHTGEELWTKTFPDNQTIAFGQLFYWESYNYQGTYAYLWTNVGTTWTAFDASTGDWRATITNMPSGTTLRDANGGLYRLQVDLTNGWMALWSMSSFVAGDDGSWGRNFMSVMGQTFNASATVNASTTVLTAEAARAWVWNVTIPKTLPGSVRATFFGDSLIGASITTTNVDLWGLSLKQGQEGQLLFQNTWTAPAYWQEGNVSISWAASSSEDKVGVMWIKETKEHYGFSLETGTYLWGPTQPQDYLDFYEGTGLTSHLIAYGKLYACGVSGIVYCYDVQTGTLLWSYAADDPYTEILWANNWWLGIVFISDGKVYVGHGEHSANQPLPRGAPFVCLNATSGEQIWRINGAFRQTAWGGKALIGDSIIATMDTYDQRIYAIGKGPSATTVTAPNIGVAAGNSLVITGTVTDISPGTEEFALTARFPNGVPAVSDDSMSDWMLYVYKQFERPANVIGVSVHLTAVDPNGNFQDIGTTTTDTNGNYGITWTPPVPGTYHVTATFEGTNSYYSSQDTTYFVVGSAVAAPQPTASVEPSVAPTSVPTVAPTDTVLPSVVPEPEAAPSTDIYVIAAAAAIIIVVVAVAAVILRKRK